MLNPLLRRFIEKTTEKSFDKGLLWGVVTGVFITRLYTEDRYRKLEARYYQTKRSLVEERIANLKPGEKFSEP